MKLMRDLELLAVILEKDKDLKGLTDVAQYAVDILSESSYFSVVSDLLLQIENIDDDNVTYLHSLEVGLLTLYFKGAMKEQLSMDFADETLLVGGLIHDIGKLKTPIHILNKPSKLTSEEFEVMKKHTTEGHFLASKYHIEQSDILDMILYHHESPDGKGYFNLSLDKVNPYAIVVGVADQFSAISQKRPYKTAKTKSETLKIMADNNVDKEIIEKIS